MQFEYFASRLLQLRKLRHLRIRTVNPVANPEFSTLHGDDAPRKSIDCQAEMLREYDRRRVTYLGNVLLGGASR